MNHNYVEMDQDTLMTFLRGHCQEIAEIACAMNVSLVLITNGMGEEPRWQLTNVGKWKEEANGQG